MSDRSKHSLKRQRGSAAGESWGCYSDRETPQLLNPATGTRSSLNAGDWIIANGVRSASGDLVAPNAEILCPPNATGPGADCGSGLGIGPGAYNWELYQPADRYRLFQGIETGLYVVLAALLVYLAVRRARRLA